MAAQQSFDITSGVDLQEVDNAVNQTKKELAQRYDFKGSKAAVTFAREESVIDLVADDEFKVEALREILMAKMVRRQVPVKNLKLSDPETVAGGLVRRRVALQQGIESETARAIAKFLRDQKDLRVQAAIQGDQLRVSSPSRDRLQTAIQRLKDEDFGLELQFGNYR